MNVRGKITEASIGGTQTSWNYDQYGQLMGNSAYYTQLFYYTPNSTTGNLTTRQNYLRSLSETFDYDTSDRLTSVTGPNALTLTYTDGKGNLTSKSDAGTFLYDNGKPYQLAHVTPYTANFPTGTQMATYTSFGKVSTLAEGNYTASFNYNADNERVKMMVSYMGSTRKTKYYFGSSYEKVVEAPGTTTEYIWIGGSPYTAVAVAKIVNGGTPVVWSIFRDHLGSITHVKNGTTVYEYSFDAFGRRRSADDWSYTLDANDAALFADRGFTGHEHLTEFGLINMNGRLYDPLVGRFLSPDNYVQSPEFTQSFNRYGYCWNNPLRYTDPEGDYAIADDIVAALIGGVVNLGVNIANGNLSHMGFWETLGKGTAAFGAGAASGTLALYGPVGWAAGGAITGGTNAWLGGQNVLVGAGVGTVSGLVGGAFGSWAAKGLGGAVINNIGISSPVLQGTVSGIIGGAAGGYTGGFTAGLIMTGDFSEANKAGLNSLWSGAAIGGVAGGIGAYSSAKKSGMNPWNGKYNKSVVIGEGMNDRVGPVANDLNSETISTDWPSNIDAYYGKNMPTGEGLDFNAQWIQSKIDNGYHIYDIGPRGSSVSSSYYNLELGRTLFYPNVHITNTYSFYGFRLTIYK